MIPAVTGLGSPRDRPGDKSQRDQRQLLGEGAPSLDPGSVQASDALLPAAGPGSDQPRPAPAQLATFAHDDTPIPVSIGQDLNQYC